jgi:hypothetical protein
MSGSMGIIGLVFGLLLVFFLVLVVEDICLRVRFVDVARKYFLQGRIGLL